MKGYHTDDKQRQIRACSSLLSSRICCRSSNPFVIYELKAPLNVSLSLRHCFNCSLRLRTSSFRLWMFFSCDRIICKNPRIHVIDMHEHLYLQCKIIHQVLKECSISTLARVINIYCYSASFEHQFLTTRWTNFTQTSAIF